MTRRHRVPDDRSPVKRPPTPAALVAAAGRTVPDLVGADLQVLFCGINPGLYSAATGHHFARPGNRFWSTLHAAGFTPRRLAPSEEQLLLPMGYGITNIVRRATASAADLSSDELVAGARRVTALVRRLQPRILAVLGVGAYRSAFGRRRATVGLQPEMIGATRIWVLPNPSGLNANYRPAELANIYRDLSTFSATRGR